MQRTGYIYRVVIPKQNSGAEHCDIINTVNADRETNITVRCIFILFGFNELIKRTRITRLPAVANASAIAGRDTTD